MANPIKMRKTGSVYNDGVQTMSDPEMDYACSLILLKVASEVNGNTADIYVDGTGTSIGTFDDNFANGALSSHPADNVTYTTSNTFQQNTSSISEASIILPISISANGEGIAPQTATELNDTLIQRCLDKIAVANTTYAETSTYFLSNTAPTISGTWVVKDTVTDTVTNNIADAGLDVDYNLYRKTSHATSPTVVLPLKAVSAGIQEMSTAEIETLTARLRNRIITTGIGTYVLQTSAPVSGTWVARGSIVDRTPTITSEQYSRQYTGQYTSQYTRLFTSQYAGQYTGGQFLRQYTSQYATQYQRQYTSQYATQFARAQFARDTVGPKFSGSAYNAQYAGTQYTRIIEGQYTGQFARATVGPQYSGSQFAGLQYNGSGFSAQYDGPGYNAQYTGVGYTLQYRVEASGQYQGFSYSEPPYEIPYWRQFTRVTGPWYVRLPYYWRQYTRVSYQRQYTREAYQRQFQRQYTRQFGRVYTSQYASQFTRLTPSTQYNAQYAGPQYTRQFQRQYTAQYNAQYTGQFARDTAGAQFAGQYARDTAGPWYTRQFTGQYTRGFSGQYASQYTRLIVDNYSGDTINPAYTTITKTLWLKVA